MTIYQCINVESHRFYLKRRNKVTRCIRCGCKAIKSKPRKNKKIKKKVSERRFPKEVKSIDREYYKMKKKIVKGIPIIIRPKKKSEKKSEYQERLLKKIDGLKRDLKYHEGTKEYHEKRINELNVCINYFYDDIASYDQKTKKETKKR